MIKLLLKGIAWLALLPFTLLRWVIAKVKRRRLAILLDLEGHHPHRPAPAAPLRPRTSTLPLRVIRDRLRRAVEDPRVELVRVRIGALQGGWAELDSLRHALLETRTAGKRLVAFVAHPDTRTLWVASAADEVLLPPAVPVQAAGISAEMPFFGEGLDRVGIDLEVIAAGEFKSAMEPFTRSEPTEANREAVDALLDDLYDHLVEDLAKGRGKTPEAVRAIFEAGPYLADDAVGAGLADALVEEEAVPDRLGFGDDGALTGVPLAAYAGVPSPWPRFRWRAPRLAVVEVRGTILDGRHDAEHPTGATIRAVCESLERARRSRSVKGVLLHVDSRGGSATASERMWREVRRLAAEKPVIAWMGDAAASGGYYVASAAHAIVAAPATLTGSIGVIAAKPVGQRLLARLGVNVVHFERGPQATMYSPARPFTEAERAAMGASIRQFYELFLQRVAEGRDRTPESVDPVARGRVWTGRQALEHGLVDVLGDEKVAERLLAERAGVPPDRGLRLIEPPRGLRQWLQPRLRVEAPWLEIVTLTRETRTLAWCPLELG